MTEKERLENKFAQSRDVPVGDLNKVGSPSAFACPECHGVLWELDDGQLVTFRCRVGHSYTPEVLMAGHSESVEDALWSALRAMEERANLSQRLSARYALSGHEALAERYRLRALDTERHTKVLRRLLRLADAANDQTVLE